MTSINGYMILDLNGARLMNDGSIDVNLKNVYEAVKAHPEKPMYATNFGFQGTSISQTSYPIFAHTQKTDVKIAIQSSFGATGIQFNQITINETGLATHVVKHIDYKVE